MRFEDWDCLLFPHVNANPTSQIPLQEFRTTCHAIQEGYQSNSIVLKDGQIRAANVSPLLTCFVSSQEHESRFYISLHCWSDAKQYVAGTPTSQQSEHKMWRVQVKLNGACVVNELLSLNTEWPRSISFASTASTQSHVQSLAFPPFDRAVADSRTFSPAEDRGRIKIELSTGFVQDQDNIRAYHDHYKIATFAFVHAPLEHLERCGIAWPNPAMFNNPIWVPVSEMAPISLLQLSQLPSPSRFMPNAPPSTPVLGPLSSTFLRSMDTDSCYDSTKSRRSSSGSAITFPQQNTSPSTLTNSRPEDERVSRLGSDIDVRASRFDSGFCRSTNMQRKDSKCMPPPVLPASAAVKRPSPSKGLLVTPTRKASPSTAATQVEQRFESYGSDISMHTACQHFPTCISEDEHGRIVHQSPAAPTTALRVRKGDAMSTSED